MSLSVVRAIAVTAALGVVAAACGGSDSPEPSAAPTPSPTEAPAPAPTTDAPVAAPDPTAAPVPGDPDRVVAAGDAISVHYVGTLDDGEQFDSSRDRDQPLSFVVASGQMIAGFDAAVHGMKLGEVKTVRIEPADAYGDVFAVPIDQVPAGTVAGDRLSASTGQSFQVVTVTETEAMLLPDHPLAGQALNFEIEIVSFDN